MTFIYVLLGILIFPFVLIFYVPCMAAYKGGSLVSQCLKGCYMRNGDPN